MDESKRKSKFIKALKTPPPSIEVSSMATTGEICLIVINNKLHTIQCIGPERWLINAIVNEATSESNLGYQKVSRIELQEYLTKEYRGCLQTHRTFTFSLSGSQAIRVKKH